MKNGGLAGESKSESLARLSRSAAFTLVTDRRPPRIDQFPVVLKPDVGERGNGVKIARTQADVDAYDFSRAVIVQEYVEGEEFGLYYYNGQLLSITRKLFPRVTGDGIRTVRELVKADDRARLIAGAYRASCDFAAVPAAGEQVQLVEIGSHCRGTVFLDGRSLWTPALADAVDRQAKMHEGFQLGRFDVRAPSVEALQRGEFRVLELNGVGAEPAHIYDPSVSLVEAYRALFRHWRFAYEAGAVFKKRQG
jgi:hypothetical protein